MAIKKANNALSAIKLVKKYFNKTELLSIITANYYSRLYYNSEIWLLDSLHVRCKQLLLSASAKALKCCMYYPDPTLSYEKIHEMNNRATPEMFTHYKQALVLFKLYNWCAVTVKVLWQKTVKLPGCPSVGASSCGWPTKKIKSLVDHNITGLAHACFLFIFKIMQ